MNKCVDCLYFDLVSRSPDRKPSTSFLSPKGHCRRNSPRPVRDTLRAWAEWPLVKEEDWCGDFLFRKSYPEFREVTVNSEVD